MSPDDWERFWADPRVHPAAEKLPMMAEDELDALAQDIKANGLLEQITLWRADDGPLYLLDGRNRLSALKRLGITDPNTPIGPHGIADNAYVADERLNPTTFVLSMNVHRRQLTREQKRQALKAYLKADPSVSNRTVAKDVGVDHKTAGKVRDELVGRGEIPHVENRTDTKGRSQPSKKPPKNPPGGVTPSTPGMTPAVQDALNKARAPKRPEEEVQESTPQSPPDNVVDLDESEPDQAERQIKQVRALGSMVTDMGELVGWLAQQKLPVQQVSDIRSAIAPTLRALSITLLKIEAK